MRRQLLFFFKGFQFPWKCWFCTNQLGTEPLHRSLNIRSCYLLLLPLHFFFLLWSEEHSYSLYLEKFHEDFLKSVSSTAVHRVKTIQTNWWFLYFQTVVELIMGDHLEFYKRKKFEFFFHVFSSFGRRGRHFNLNFFLPFSPCLSLLLWYSVTTFEFYWIH